MNNRMCGFCGQPLTQSVVDLGMSPLSNSYLKDKHLHCVEPFYPLRAFVCDSCFLVQIEMTESPEHIFKDYAYFSSYSDTWLQHAREYADYIAARLGLNSNKTVIEIAIRRFLHWSVFLGKIWQENWSIRVNEPILSWETMSWRTYRT